MWFGRRKSAIGIYNATTSGQRPWWARPFAFSGVQTTMGYLASAVLIYSIWYGFDRVNCRNFESGVIQTDACQIQGAPTNTPLPQPQVEKRITRVGLQKAVLVMIWVLIPPIWFWLEYYGIWRYEDQTKRQSIEDLKFGQELAAKIWLAAVTSLSILYFGKDIKGG